MTMEVVAALMTTTTSDHGDSSSFVSSGTEDNADDNNNHSDPGETATATATAASLVVSEFGCCSSSHSACSSSSSSIIDTTSQHSNSSSSSSSCYHCDDDDSSMSQHRLVEATITTTCDDEDATSTANLNASAVRFGQVDIYEFAAAIGDSPAVSKGVPTTLSSEGPVHHETTDIDAYESCRSPRRRQGRQLYLTEEERADRLLREGYHHSEIARAAAAVQKLRKKQRRRKLQLRYEQQQHYRDAISVQGIRERAAETRNRLQNFVNSITRTNSDEAVAPPPAEMVYDIFDNHGDNNALPDRFRRRSASAALMMPGLVSPTKSPRLRDPQQYPATPPPRWINNSAQSASSQYKRRISVECGKLNNSRMRGLVVDEEEDHDHQFPQSPTKRGGATTRRRKRDSVQVTLDRKPYDKSKTSHQRRRRGSFLGGLRNISKSYSNSSTDTSDGEWASGLSSPRRPKRTNSGNRRGSFFGSRRSSSGSSSSGSTSTSSSGSSTTTNGRQRRRGSFFGRGLHEGNKSPSSDDCSSPRKPVRRSSVNTNAERRGSSSSAEVGGPRENVVPSGVDPQANHPEETTRPPAAPARRASGTTAKSTRRGSFFGNLVRRITPPPEDETQQPLDEPSTMLDYYHRAQAAGGRKGPPGRRSSLSMPGHISQQQQQRQQLEASTSKAKRHMSWYGGMEGAAAAAAAAAASCEPSTSAKQEEGGGSTSFHLSPFTSGTFSEPPSEAFSDVGGHKWILKALGSPDTSSRVAFSPLSRPKTPSPRSRRKGPAAGKQQEPQLSPEQRDLGYEPIFVPALQKSDHEETSVASSSSSSSSSRCSENIVDLFCKTIGVSNIRAAERRLTTTSLESGIAAKKLQRQQESSFRAAASGTSQEGNEKKKRCHSWSAGSSSDVEPRLHFALPSLRDENARAATGARPEATNVALAADTPQKIVLSPKYSNAAASKARPRRASTSSVDLKKPRRNSLVSLLTQQHRTSVNHLPSDFAPLARSPHLSSDSSCSSPADKPTKRRHSLLRGYRRFSFRSPSSSTGHPSDHVDTSLVSPNDQSAGAASSLARPGEVSRQQSDSLDGSNHSWTRRRGSFFGLISLSSSSSEESSGQRREKSNKRGSFFGSSRSTSGASAVERRESLDPVPRMPRRKVSVNMVASDDEIAAAASTTRRGSFFAGSKWTETASVAKYSSSSPDVPSSGTADVPDNSPGGPAHDERDVREGKHKRRGSLFGRIARSLSEESSRQHPKQRRGSLFGGSFSMGGNGRRSSDPGLSPRMPRRQGSAREPYIPTSVNDDIEPDVSESERTQEVIIFQSTADEDRLTWDSSHVHQRLGGAPAAREAGMSTESRSVGRRASFPMFGGSGDAIDGFNECVNATKQPRRKSYPPSGCSDFANTEMVRKLQQLSHESIRPEVEKQKRRGSLFSAFLSGKSSGQYAKRHQRRGSFFSGWNSIQNSVEPNESLSPRMPLRKASLEHQTTEGGEYGYERFGGPSAVRHHYTRRRRRGPLLVLGSIFGVTRISVNTLSVLRHERSDPGFMPKKPFRKASLDHRCHNGSSKALGRGKSTIADGSVRRKHGHGGKRRATYLGPTRSYDVSKSELILAASSSKLTGSCSCYSVSDSSSGASYDDHRLSEEQIEMGYDLMCFGVPPPQESRQAPRKARPTSPKRHRRSFFGYPRPGMTSETSLGPSKPSRRRSVEHQKKAASQQDTSESSDHHRASGWRRGSLFAFGRGSSSRRLRANSATSDSNHDTQTVNGKSNGKRDGETSSLLAVRKRKRNGSFFGVKRGGVELAIADEHLSLESRVSIPGGSTSETTSPSTHQVTDDSRSKVKCHTMCSDDQLPEDDDDDDDDDDDNNNSHRDNVESNVLVSKEARESETPAGEQLKSCPVPCNSPGDERTHSKGPAENRRSNKSNFGIQSKGLSLPDVVLGGPCECLVSADEKARTYGTRGENLGRFRRRVTYPTPKESLGWTYNSLTMIEMETKNDRLAFARRRCSLGAPSWVECSTCTPQGLPELPMQQGRVFFEHEFSSAPVLNLSSALANTPRGNTSFVLGRTPSSQDSDALPPNVLAETKKLFSGIWKVLFALAVSLAAVQSGWVRFFLIFTTVACLAQQSGMLKVQAKKQPGEQDQEAFVENGKCFCAKSSHRRTKSDSCLQRSRRRMMQPEYQPVFALDVYGSVHHRDHIGSRKVKRQRRGSVITRGTDDTTKSSQLQSESSIRLNALGYDEPMVDSTPPPLEVIIMT